MYLTRVELNPTRNATATALMSPSKLHGAIEVGFHGDRKRRLWRIDHLNNSLYLLLVSEDVPNLKNVLEQFGTGQKWETREYDSFLERIHEGDLMQFRLTANPTRSISQPAEGGNKKRGKVVAHTTPEHQREWLLKKADSCGFRLDPDAFTVSGSRWIKFWKEKEGRPVTLLQVTYEGLLTVSDRELFQKALREGIGRERAYGMGLMTVIRRYHYDT